MLAEIDAVQEMAGPERLRLPRATWGLSLKFAVEFGISLTLLILTLPLIVLSVILVKVTSAGPGIYSQTRLGRNGRPYRIFKIRTMVHNCEHLSGPQWSTPGDSRITPVGRFLRKTHLDELPQLWNVLRGEMSLVGPRPERPEFAIHLEQVIPFYQYRLVVRPGVTGFAQVQLPADTDLESVSRKLAYDIYYVQHLSPLLDLKIILSTAFKMFGVSFRTMRTCFGLPNSDKVMGEFNRLTVRRPKNHTTVYASPANGPQVWNSTPVAAGRVF
jgi:lipopolysaccharide/colanic/teichoic acid biosynthesis glycosyltransferase